jgi:hypothetical protein
MGTLTHSLRWRLYVKIVPVRDIVVTGILPFYPVEFPIAWVVVHWFRFVVQVHLRAWLLRHFQTAHCFLTVLLAEGMGVEPIRHPRGLQISGLLPSPAIGLPFLVVCSIGGGSGGRTHTPPKGPSVFKTAAVASYRLAPPLSLSLVRQTGIEPATSCLEGRCSTELSY